MGSERWFRRLSARATPSGTGDSSLHHFESKEPLARPFMSRHHSVPCPTPQPARRVVAHCGSSVSSQLYLCHWQRSNPAFTVACINIYVNARANVANCLEKRWRERNRVNSRIGQPEEAEAKLYCREVVESLIIKYQTRRWDSARPAPAAKKTAARRGSGASR